MSKGIVFDIMRFSTHDGPGIRTTVFLKGCPLNCAWCHNPESQSIKPELMVRPNLCILCRACLQACPQGAIALQDGQIATDTHRCVQCAACVESCYTDAREWVGQEMTVDAVMVEVVKDIPIYDESNGGVTFSGGEALMQPDFLADLLVACQQRGIHTALDTSGFAPWAAFERVRNRVDLFLYDLKAVSDAVHRQATGVSNALILANLHRLAQFGHAIILRMPLVPGVNDGEADLRAAVQLAASLPGVVRLDVLPYHKIGMDKYQRLNRSYPMAQTEPPSSQQVDQAVTILRQTGIPIQVGG